MTDIASLSFNIDSSQVQPATQNLDALTAAADKVRGSTRFLVSSFGSTQEALTQLATSGRASLASFEAISQNLDTVTARLEAMRTAAAATVGTLTGSGVQSALSTFQQQFDAMSTLFGTSAAQLENFNRQAQYLGMNSYQVTSALQRITEAMQNMTPGGQAIRQSLNMEGISTSGGASSVLQQIVGYAAQHQQSQLSYNTLQEVLGPLDPATMARLLNQPYRPIAQQNAFANQQILGTESNQVADRTAGLSYQNQYNSQNYDDISQNYAFGSTFQLNKSGERQRVMQAMQAKIDADKAAGRSTAQDQATLTNFQGLQYGSEDYVNAAGNFAHANPGDGLGDYLTATGLQNQAGAPRNGKANWWSRFNDTDLFNTNKSAIGAEYDQRRQGLNTDFLYNLIHPSSAIANFDNNTEAAGDYLKNQLGLYTDQDQFQRQQSDLQGQADDLQADLTPRGRAATRFEPSADIVGQLASVKAALAKLTAAGDSANRPVGAAELYQLDSSDAAIGSQFGYNGFGEALNAATSVQSLQQDTGPNSTGDKLRKLFGTTEGNAILGQQIDNQQYIAKNAATPGFDQLQQLRASGFVTSQTTGSGEANALEDYMKSLRLDPGRLQGMSVSDIIGGNGAPGAVLTPVQRTAFGNIWQQYLSNASSAQNTQFAGQQALVQGTTGIAQSADGSGQYDAQVAGLQAYQQVMRDTGNVAQAFKAQTEAVTIAFENQAVSAIRATKALKDQNDEAAKGIAAGTIALGGGQGGGYAASQFNTGISDQLQAYQLQFPGASPAQVAAQRLQITRLSQQGLVSGVQGDLGQIQNQYAASRGTLAAFGQGTDATNRAEITGQYQDQLSEATGQYRQSIMDSINSMVSFKDGIDQTTQAISALNNLVQLDVAGNATQAQLNAAPGTGQVAAATYQTVASLEAQSNPMSALSAAQQATVAPYQKAAAAAQAATGTPASFILANAFKESSGDPTQFNPAGPDGGTLGLGQFTHPTAVEYGLAGPGFDNRTSPSASIMAMGKKYADLMKKTGGHWGNPLAQQTVAANYGTIPHAMIGYGLTGPNANIIQAAGDQAGQNVILQEKLAAQQTGYQTGTIGAQLAAAAPYLARGNTGSASLAQASVINPNTPTFEQAADRSAQLVQAQDNLTREVISLTAATKTSAQNSKTLGDAYAKGPMAVLQAQAQNQAMADARETGNQNSPDYISTRFQQILDGLKSDEDNQLKSKNAQGTQRISDLTIPELQNAVNAKNPYQLTEMNAKTEADYDNNTTYAGASDATKQSNVALAEQAAQLDIIAQKQQEVASGMGQIGSAVSGTLENLVFSYQQGPGAGLYARKQVAGLLNDTSRSLFNTAIGDPIDRYVSGGLSSAVNNLLGNNAPSDNSNSSDGSNGQTGGGQGQGLVGGLLGSVGGSLLSGIGNLFGSNSPSVFSTSSLIAHQGGQVASAVAAPAVSAASSALSSIGSAIMSFFATGGMFEGGTRVPFATGGVFGSGTRHAYASGDVFTDPTTMPMAILGEAGPEAVMPLRRGADGKLGIATGGGGGGGGPSVVVNAPISVGANALGNNGKMSSQQARDLQNQLHRTIKAAVFGVMADQSRPGGMITPPAG